MTEIMESQLAREWATWERERARLLAEHEGQWALIIGDVIAGIFSAEVACLDAGERQCGDAPFLPKLIVAGDEVIDLGLVGTIGFAANRRLLGVQRTARDAIAGEDSFRRIHDPITTATGVRIAGLRFGDQRVYALMHALIVLAVLPGVIRARQLRSHLGTQPACSGKCTPGRTTYDLRRLRHHGLIERIPHRLAYRVTDLGMRTAMFYLHAYDALVGPGTADLDPDIAAADTLVRRAYQAWEKAWQQHAAKALGRAA